MPLLAPAQSEDKLIRKLLRSKPEWFGPVLENPGKYDVQILYTRVDRDKDNQPQFTTHTWRADPKQYFLPGQHREAAGRAAGPRKAEPPGPARPRQAHAPAHRQRLRPANPRGNRLHAENGLPSIGHYVRKILLVSDNDAFNRLLEFVGQRPFNEAFHAKGYKDLKITRRLQVGSTPRRTGIRTRSRSTRGTGIVPAARRV
jgi:hypothetical protein